MAGKEREIKNVIIFGNEATSLNLLKALTERKEKKQGKK
jgi:hypothetical protein